MNQLLSSGFQIAGAIILPQVNPWGEYDEFASCWVIGFCLYFFTVSSNAWLVVINFDLWNTFRNKYQRDLQSDKSRFLIYSLFGWGMPIIAATIVGTLEATLPDGHDFKPSIATDRCFLSFENTYSIILYFYLVLGLMLTYNFVIFTWTNVILCSVQSKVARAKKDSNRKQVVTRFFLFFKLFCVMGTTWVISLALWILGYDCMNLKDRSNIARFFQLFNVFHGFCYFIVFVCKPSIYRLMKKKFQRASKADDSEPGTSSRRISSMTLGMRSGNTGSINSTEKKAAV
ncbi:unnamed protein product [Allacma fusca]|uniref:G-protein coupled receptors family 2 profile 2 domain-containing protein n=1 Tax=Allacma fusca TaxID=39272 RepID=A0A8J2KST3_9HEXA|nr:unnamed protein product [Allacma fusca]